MCLVSCLNDNVANLGTRLDCFFNFASPFLCQFECQKRADCVAFNFNKKDQTCDLLSNTSLNQRTDPYYLTGPKFCGNMDGIIN